MQEFNSAKYSSAYLNGIKDSLNPNQSGADPGNAIQDLLRAASLLGGLGFSPGATAPPAHGHTPTPTKHDSASRASSGHENGQGSGGKSSANGKANDDTLASEDSGELLTFFFQRKFEIKRE